MHLIEALKALAAGKCVRCALGGWHVIYRLGISRLEEFGECGSWISSLLLLDDASRADWTIVPDPSKPADPVLRTAEDVKAKPIEGDSWVDALGFVIRVHRVELECVVVSFISKLHGLQSGTYSLNHLRHLLSSAKAIMPKPGSTKER